MLKNQNLEIWNILKRKYVKQLDKKWKEKFHISKEVRQEYAQ